MTNMANQRRKRVAAHLSRRVAVNHHQTEAHRVPQAPTIQLAPRAEDYAQMQQEWVEKGYTTSKWSSFRNRTEGMSSCCTSHGFCLYVLDECRSVCCLWCFQDGATNLKTIACPEHEHCGLQSVHKLQQSWDRCCYRCDSKDDEVIDVPCGHVLCNECMDQQSALNQLYSGTTPEDFLCRYCMISSPHAPPLRRADLEPLDDHRPHPAATNVYGPPRTPQPSTSPA